MAEKPFWLLYPAAEKTRMQTDLRMFAGLAHVTIFATPKEDFYLPLVTPSKPLKHGLDSRVISEGRACTLRGVQDRTVRPTAWERLEDDDIVG